MSTNCSVLRQDQSMLQHIIMMCGFENMVIIMLQIDDYYTYSGFKLTEHVQMSVQQLS